jgi:ABC-type multidrug transport system ATPase subunit
MFFFLFYFHSLLLSIHLFYSLRFHSFKVANRKTTGKITGDVRLNGVKVSEETFARITGYCEQVDLHAPEQTVAEAILFSITLRSGDKDPHRAKVALGLILNLLEITSLVHRQVSTLSPGEAKKLTIAVELGSNPSVLFLDEPTSGLDALSASQVIRAIRRVADSGRTIICTIHQPSADVFFAFDQLMLLAPGGWMMYAGPTGNHASQLVSYLESLPGVPPIEAGVNPANWMLDILKAPSVQKAAQSALSKDTDGDAKTSDGANKLLGAPPFTIYYSRSEVAKKNLLNISDAIETGRKYGPVVKHARASFFKQVSIVFLRTWYEYARSRYVMPIRLTVVIFLSLLFGMIWYKLDLTTASGVQSLIGFVTAGPIFVAIVMYMTVSSSVSNMRAIFYRERAAHAYTSEAFAITLGLADLPWLLLFSLMFASISYFSM